MSLLHTAKQCLAKQTKYAGLNAFISLAPEPFVLSRAAAADDVATAEEKSQGLNSSPRGDLVAIKDNICTADLPTTAASGILKKFISPYDATVVKQLREAGAIIAGKTNLDEFGMGSHSVHSKFGPVKHEAQTGTQLSAGGSSGGSAVAVASGQCVSALGTDTGGSVRLPAAYTSLVGFKPSYGLLSRWGVIAYANSLDTVGIMANEVEPVQNLFKILNEYDHQDPTSLSPSTRSRLGAPHAFPKESLRVGIPMEYNISSLDPTVKATWRHALGLLHEAGHSLHPVSLPNTCHALSAYYILAPAEASSNLAKYDGVRYGTRAQGIDGTPSSVLFAKTRGLGFGPEVQRRILLGAFSLSAQAIDNYFLQAQKTRRLVQEDFNAIFARINPLTSSDTATSFTDGQGVDVLLSPTAPTPAPLLSSLEDKTPLDAYMNDVFTVPASLAGLPAISVPVEVPGQTEPVQRYGRKSMKQVGMQIIGQYGDDQLVLDVAAVLEEANRKASSRV